MAIQLNQESTQKLLEKIKSMPDFNQVFVKHVEECAINKCDPFITFTEKAVKYWNLCEYVTYLYMSERQYLTQL